MGRASLFHLVARCVSGVRRIRARIGSTGAGRSRIQKTNPVPGAAVCRCDCTIEFPGDESRSAQARDRDGRRQYRPGNGEPDRRRAARAHRDDRRIGFRGRCQPGALAWQRGVPQRANRVDPVRAGDPRSVQATASSRAGVHQQVLHPRLGTEKFLRAAHRRCGTYDVHDLLAQHSAGAGASDVGRLPRTRRAAGHRRRAGNLRQPDHQRARFLRRRNAPRLFAGGAGRPPRAPGRKRHVPHDDARFRRLRRYRRVRIARIPRCARAGAACGRASPGRRAGQRVCQPQAQ